MDVTPRASTNEPGSGNGNNTKGTGVAMCHMGRLLPTRQQIHRLRRRIFQLSLTLSECKHMFDVHSHTLVPRSNQIQVRLEMYKGRRWPNE